MKIILLVAPGAGKGTQAAELVKRYNLTHISTGEMFRDAIAKQTEMGKLANSLISKGYKPYDDKEFIFIEDYYFDRNKNFDSSGKIVAIPLLKKIIDNKNKNILAIAAAIGEDSYSPANLYFRYGFKPFTQTKEEIEKQIIETPKGDRINPKYAIPIYLPDDAKLYQIIKRYKGLDEIDKIYSNWL